MKVHFAFTFTVPHIHSSPISVRVGDISLKTILQYFRENCNYIYNNTGEKNNVVLVTVACKQQHLIVQTK